MADLYELSVSVDGVPLLVYPESEGGKRYICSIESASYTPRLFNRSLDTVACEWSIDSKVQGRYVVYPNSHADLLAPVRGPDANSVVYVNYHFAGLGLPQPGGDNAVVPVEDLDKLGRIDVIVMRAKPDSRGVRVRAWTKTIDDVQTTVSLPNAKRKVGGCATRITTNPAKTARVSDITSEYRADHSSKLATITLYYRPSRTLRLYGLVGLKSFDLSWADWVRTFQFTRIPSLEAPDELVKLQPPNAATPPTFLSPILETQTVADTNMGTTRQALQVFARENDLTLEYEGADLQSVLSVLLWGGVHHRNVVVRCVEFQRQHNRCHYEALVRKGTWSEDAIILKAFSDFFQVPVVLYSPGLGPAQQALLSPLMNITRVCFALGMLRDTWVVLRGLAEQKSSVTVVELSD